MSELRNLLIRDIMNVTDMNIEDLENSRTSFIYHRSHCLFGPQREFSIPSDTLTVMINRIMEHLEMVTHSMLEEMDSQSVMHVLFHTCVNSSNPMNDEEIYKFCLNDIAKQRKILSVEKEPHRLTTDDYLDLILFAQSIQDVEYEKELQDRMLSIQYQK